MSWQHRVYCRYGKRAADILGSLFALSILPPAFFIIALLIRLESPGPALFVQTRTGRNGRMFKLYKFRSMRLEAVDNGQVLSDIERMTTMGRVMRKTSIDELPQLINILRGEMSFVGPRPLLPEYLKLYSEDQIRRHNVLPGITGWAQANGRNSLTWEEKFRLDVWYVDNLSAVLDLKIILLTVLKVVIGTGVNQSQSKTMVPFKGTSEV